VEVTTMEEAERARQAVNRTMVDGQLILVFIVAPPSLTWASFLHENHRMANGCWPA